MLNNLDQMLAYESGEIDSQGFLELFSSLIASGDAWRLQGHYGRTATMLIAQGTISKTGEILEEVEHHDSSFT